MPHAHYLDIYRLLEEDKAVISMLFDLSNFFMLNYFTDKGYKLLPAKWLSVAAPLGKEFLLDYVQSFLSESHQNRSVFPLSLLCFNKMVKMRLQKRTFTPPKHQIPIFSKKVERKHLKPKKVLELELILSRIGKFINEHGVSHIVDIGSGVGHMSRFVASHFKQCKVLRIEAQTELVEKANRIDEKFFQTDEEIRIFSAACKIAVDNTGISQFTRILKDIDSHNDTSFSESKLLLIGLHPCGNLGSFLLKLYKEYPKCGGIIIISCCYLFIDPDEENVGGFPLSSHLLTNGPQTLSLQLKEQACHNTEFYLTRLFNHLNSDVEVSQHWRSIADIFIKKRDADYLNNCYRFRKRKSNESFDMFINRNLNCHNFNTLTDEEINEANQMSKMDNWDCWVYYFVYIVKMFLGVFGESLVLNDRLLCLVEGGFECSVEAIFPPFESPRNLAIISSK